MFPVYRLQWRAHSMGRVMKGGAVVAGLALLVSVAWFVYAGFSPYLARGVAQSIANAKAQEVAGPNVELHEFESFGGNRYRGIYNADGRRLDVNVDGEVATVQEGLPWGKDKPGSR